MPGREIRCTVNLDIWYSINGSYTSYHVLLDQFYDYISYSKHKRCQLSDRLAIVRNQIQSKYTIPEIRNLWNDRSNILNISSSTTLDDFRRTCEEFKAELEEDNLYLQNILEEEVETHRQNEKRIRELEREYSQCESEIQSLNREIEWLENSSEEEILELKSEIFTLKSQLYQARKDIQDKDNYISSLEKKLLESEE
ncbi:hypothetical protein GLOIN_2v1792321 [Rhizophagus clarus]|uniref:Uncharacterized protein n=1 Tax=Rhizophagus clarus TaxID=94130 RepID=A0A8H3QGX4_9GLOM|nr:hypothetical protein GLOIN_2v1792321 [Rhizophagus clarus]